MRKLLLWICVLSLGGFTVTGSQALPGSHAFSVERQEELGLEPGLGTGHRVAQPLALRSTFLLLIPDSDADVIGAYDPYDGTYVGDFNVSNPGFLTPINAVQGPDHQVYVSDQTADAVFVFDMSGNYVYTYADASDGLDNVRGIAFRDDELFVSCGGGHVARFDGPHNRLPDFVNDGSDPFDVYFLTDGTMLLADIAGSTDNIRYYDADGVLQYELFTVSFPEQIQYDPLLPGTYLNAAFSANVITDFDLDGTIYQTLPFSGGRGIYRLGNGNLLATKSTGVYELDALTGAPIELEHGGAARYIEELVEGSGVIPSEDGTRLALAVSPSLAREGLQVRFSLTEAGPAEVGVYEVSGRCAARLFTGWASGGAHTLVWSGRLADGSVARAGVYWVRLQATSGVEARRLVWMR